MSTAYKVYDLTKKIPGGKVTTYGIIAKKLKTSPRAIVVMSNGMIGGYHGKHSEL